MISKKQMKKKATRVLKALDRFEDRLNSLQGLFEDLCCEVSDLVLLAEMDEVDDSNSEK